ncbi:MAG: 2-hydroxyacyl-CoA dehydratase [Deltaproteobacteria bacterium]|jgi:predicted CoA-substrate-specific enzyme activase|nr:2-hydroxyacyl-CoA dehydratase [Deltaproteobacteria bacterium]
MVNHYNTSQLKVERTGIDVGSTTVKLVLLDHSNSILFQDYRWHFSDVRRTVGELLQDAAVRLGDIRIAPVMSGSGGLALSRLLDIPFEQEVIAGTRAIEVFAPQADVAVELGGEDAKLTYFDSHGVDQRMNNSCAGGTGAFIDQMATLLGTDAAGLNELAKSHKNIYPIASRCGVFAKTDIQPLINEGASKEDIAASILQAIVNQTIGGLACGKPIRGKVAFLGGPLNFLSVLRELFINTLGLGPDEVIFPENAKLFVAMGAALLAAPGQASLTIGELARRLAEAPENTLSEASLLPPLFADEAELEEFRTRHGREKVARGDIATYSGNVFVGIDSGSTTTKAVAIGECGELLYSYYSSNKGNPVEVVRELIRDFYSRLPAQATVAGVTTTGYGEKIIKAAFRADHGEVETVAHYKAADRMLPGVEFILDIGGQDMKCLTMREGAIHSISLNEACSAGCGSFIETFAKSLQYEVKDFAALALTARRPVDLGTRCTVFMNSKVKQAQKEGASIPDISAGISYAVIRNALFKVIRLRRIDDLPEKIIVQGGTFYNEAVLRAFERLTGRRVVRMDIAGLMGAYGAALIAMEKHVPGQKCDFIRPHELDAFTVEKRVDYCRNCGNKCRLMINTFNDGREFVSGNRCERGARDAAPRSVAPNLYQYKLERIFAYEPLRPEEARRGSVGIPRVLNQYENYPFWHTFFTYLGFRVVLSPASSSHIYQMGIETIPSESACYPAKLVHGHIEALIARKVDFIFFPSATYEWKEFEHSDNHFNCPVVGCYPEVIRNNIDAVQRGQVRFHNPFLDFNDPDSMFRVLCAEFKNFGVSRAEISRALGAAAVEMDKVRADIRAKGRETLEELERSGQKGVVLAGRPYHIDPGINHGIDKIITEEGMAVLTEDSVAHLGAARIAGGLRVVDQWSYHARLYAAASLVATRPSLELVQLTSFGCGLDALTTDQVDEILQAENKIYTLIKIDEGTNLGAARIRIRSLKAAMEDRDKQEHKPAAPTLPAPVRSPFTEDMRGEYTILAPQMSPIHFRLLEPVFRSEGYRVEILDAPGRDALECGLKYVHNDTCYPCIMVIGQLIEALRSGRYDLNRTALILSQTGGQCRATNYIALMRKALKDLGCEQVPIISLNPSSKLDHNPGFKYSFSLIKKAVMAIMYGDLLMRCLYRVRPYELVKGAADFLYEKWNQRCSESLLSKSSLFSFSSRVNAIVNDFEKLPISQAQKPRVGVVGEILVKFHPEANNKLVEHIESEGGEAVVPDLLDFFLYCSHGVQFDRKNYGLNGRSFWGANLATSLIEWLRGFMRRRLEASPRFGAPVHIRKLAKLSAQMVSLGNQSGEGWLLTGEMMELAESGVNNIVCVQPFACLPNHITGRGMMKALKERYPKSNITAIDYDPGVSEVNQINRLKLMMSVARNALEKETLERLKSPFWQRPSGLYAETRDKQMVKMQETLFWPRL